MLKRLVTVAVSLATANLLAASTVRAAEPPHVGPHGERLVPLEIALPKPLFQGTPKHIGRSPTLEPYNEKARPPFSVPEGTTNLALHKKATSSDSQPLVGELAFITDGDKEGAEGSYVELGPDKQWVQIDLGAAAEVYAIVVWHYHGEARVYHDVAVQLADDSDFIENVQTIFNNDFDNSSGLGVGQQMEYIEDYRGKLINACDTKGEPAKARYVRLYSKGNTSNDMNHYIEVEVYGKPAK